MDRELLRSIERTADIIRQADAIVIGAGAGMGVDSGLPDFRGTAGFWKAYPPYARLGLDFAAMANPRWFVEDPEKAWGFYGHRLALYRRTSPHAGFDVLKGWAADAERGAFVFTSNVDGQFQRAGFDPDRVLEVHGAIDWMQCLGRCGAGIFPAELREVEIDPDTMRAVPPLPACPNCGGLARPNILMFGDGGWNPDRTDAQLDRLNAWLAGLGGAATRGNPPRRDRHRLDEWLSGPSGARLAIVECGAGTAIPTVRRASENFVRHAGGILVRINPREPEVPAGQIGIAAGALDALRAIDAWLA